MDLNQFQGKKVVSIKLGPWLQIEFEDGLRIDVDVHNQGDTTLTYYLIEGESMKDPVLITFPEFVELKTK